MISKNAGICGGEPCIDGHNITVEHVKALYFNEAQSVDDILFVLPTLQRDEVIEAIEFEEKFYRGLRLAA